MLPLISGRRWNCARSRTVAGVTPTVSWAVSLDPRHHSYCPITRGQFLSPESIQPHYNYYTKNRVFHSRLLIVAVIPLYNTSVKVISIGPISLELMYLPKDTGDLGELPKFQYRSQYRISVWSAPGLKPVLLIEKRYTSHLTTTLNFVCYI